MNCPGKKLPEMSASGIEAGKLRKNNHDMMDETDQGKLSTILHQIMAPTDNYETTIFLFSAISSISCA